jgi:hypothetical protein
MTHRHGTILEALTALWLPAYKLQTVKKSQVKKRHAPMHGKEAFARNQIYSWNQYALYGRRP